MEIEDKKMTPMLIVSFRGQKVAMQLEPGVSVEDVKARVTSAVDPTLCLHPSDIKLIHKGKILNDDQKDILELLVGGNKPAKTFRVMATGMSLLEAQASNQEFQEGIKKAPRIRDDLTAEGRMEIARRQRLGQKMNATKRRAVSAYAFGRIETLPMMPQENKARQILMALANDPGILACMAKHKWNVGSLAELFPEGKVGESQVCVMGLNKNKGQQILLRIRTDDLKGFRKMLSIRKVLFHELAHNEHSEHNGEFFKLMRQIERECNELDWTQGAGLTNDGVLSEQYVGGSYRLGGTAVNLPMRELTARAAMMRLTSEEEEIQLHCGCGKQISTMPTQTINSDDLDESGSKEKPSGTGGKND